MLIEEKALQHWIDHFYGYGSWNAKFWFISYEEGGGDLPEEVSEKLNYFESRHTSAQEPTLCDLRDLFKNVTFRYEGSRAEKYSTMHDYRFERNAIQNNIWKNLISFEHGYQNKKLPSDLLKYQKSSFVAPESSKEALIQLFPLPSPHNHAWYYSWLDVPGFPYLKSRSLYQGALYEPRIQTILKMIKKHQPEVVVMYGMNNINDLKTSFMQAFPSSKFKMMKAVPQQIPQHHLCNIDATKLLITTQIPALRHNRIETGFDWEALGKTLR